MNNVPLNVEKIVLGTIIILGYIASSLLLLFFKVPTGNEQLVAQALSLLGPVVGIIAASAWPKQDGSQAAATLDKAVDKLPPPTGEAQDAKEPL